MEVKIQHWGNSAAIRLPSSVLKQLNIGAGSSLKIDVNEESGSITLTRVKAKPKYDLAELQAQCDLSAPEPEEMAAWNSITLVGREL